LKGLLVTFFGKFFDGRKSLVDRPNNPIAIAALKPAGFVIDLLGASDEMLFVARKERASAQYQFSECDGRRGDE
jgi:hypothetical protein